ncbi:probable elongation factor 1-delta isoform X2 [Bemisia tabaci]|uniref:probable elongation factor 1-delta isoform X2 n=1 Tax=Bemisia tabaci TaxID=7038 RepID=UPI0008F9DED0|nr:PREDICTED: probable elongation factor 1-delta [Bemisia tabaci]
MTAEDLAKDSVWLDKSKYDEAERAYYEKLNKVPSISSQSQSKSLVEEIVKAREHIKVSLKNVDGFQDLPSTSISNDMSEVVRKLQTDYNSLKSDFDKVTSLLQRIEIRVKNLENSLTTESFLEKKSSERTPGKKENDDDDIDLFGSEDEDEEAKRVKEQRLAEYAAKKSKKPAVIAKSMIIFDVKPWDDETDMKAMEVEVRKIAMDGLLWGSAKLVPLAYGIHKLQIASVVEDDKVSVDDISDKIQEIEDFVQSVDIAAFNKI